MIERQILEDTINVGWPHKHASAQCSAAFGAFALQQVASARASAEDFPVRGYLETFGH